MRNIVLGLFVIISMLGSSGCALLETTFKRPEILKVRPRISGIDLRGIDLAFDIEVNNPYPVPIKTPRFRYGLAIEGSQFLSQESAAGIDLPAGKVGVATLPVRVSYLDLWNAFSHLRGANEVNYQLDGAFLMSLGGRHFELPMSHAGKLPILRPPKFRVLRFQPPEVSLSRAKISVDAQITNPNVFGIGVKALGYALKIGDLSIGNLTVSTAEEIGAGKTGSLKLVGEISALQALRGLLADAKLGAIGIRPTGVIQTPYGKVQLPEVSK